MAPFGRGRNGALSQQELTGFFPPTAHMLSLAGFAALGQQLNGMSNGFAAPKTEMQVSLLSTAAVVLSLLALPYGGWCPYLQTRLFLTMLPDSMQAAHPFKHMQACSAVGPPESCVSGRHTKHASMMALPLPCCPAGS